MTTATTSMLTLEHFAALQPCCVDDVNVFGGVLLARIHARHNRDEDVLARALVFIPRSDVSAENHLARLTIRTSHLTIRTSNRTYEDVSRGKAYAELLQTVLSLSVLELEAGA